MKLIKKTISVLLVDDSPIVIAILRSILAATDDIVLIGTAHNGQEALRLIPQLNPDVVCTDLSMPVMDGLALITEIMATFPRPVIVISGHVGKESENVFKLLEAGALDVIAKPCLDSDEQFAALSSNITSKIRIASGVHVFRRRRKVVPADSINNEVSPCIVTKIPTRIIVMGASTGGPQALVTILSSLAADFDVPIVCIQHISGEFLAGLVGWLSTNCRLKIEFAQDRATPEPGVVYFSPENKQLTFSNGRFTLIQNRLPKDSLPSITLCMESAADCYGSGVVGVLLTGMGNDGAEGLLKISIAGGVTIAQDEKSCIVFGMPNQAIKLNAAMHILPLDEIATTLKRLTKQAA